MREFTGYFLLMLMTVCAAEYASAQEGGKPAAIDSGIAADKGIILVGKGVLIIEPEITYAHITANRLDFTGFTVIPAIHIGLIQVEKIKRDIFIPSVTLKYGLTDRSQVDIRVPYFIRSDAFITGVETSREKNTVYEAGFGDIEGMLSFHVVREEESVPDVVATLNVKSNTGRSPYGLSTQTVQGIQLPEELPTGSGHWAIEPGISLLKTEDPAIMFGNISYFHHMRRNINDAGIVDPSDSINYSLGIGYALNDRIALSAAFEQNFFLSATIDGDKQIDSEIVVANLLFGASYSVSERRSLGFTLSIGLTQDSPDIQVSLKMPLSVL